MVARVAFPGSAGDADGTTHLAADDAKLPGGYIGYVEITADQTGITSEVDIAGLSVTVTVNTTRRIKLTAFCQGWFSSVTGDRATLFIKEGATYLCAVRSYCDANGISTNAPIAQRVLTPSAGSHTYKVAFERNAGTGTLTFGAIATAPSFLVIEDIGPSS